MGRDGREQGGGITLDPVPAPNSVLARVQLDNTFAVMRVPGAALLWTKHREAKWTIAPRRLREALNMQDPVKDAIRDAFMALDVTNASILMNEASGNAPVLEARLAIENAVPESAVVWEVLSAGQGRIWINDAFRGSAGLATRLTWTLPLLWEYHRGGDVVPGVVGVNLGDADYIPGIAFCSSNPEIELVPDPEFMDLEGYRNLRQSISEANVPWEKRIGIAFWRGSTTGIRHPREWRTLPRARLCEITRASTLFDVGMSSIVQIAEQDIIDEIKSSGLMRDYVPVTQFKNYRYHIDIDGNTNSWSGLLQKLLSGGTVLKVESERGFRQWYYDRLMPWKNFVPIAADMSDLVEKVDWLTKNDDSARKIAAAGCALAATIDWPDELRLAAPAISRAIGKNKLPLPRGAALSQALFQ